MFVWKQARMKRTSLRSKALKVSMCAACNAKRAPSHGDMVFGLQRRGNR
jgi:hypothetical protein